MRRRILIGGEPLSDECIAKTKLPESVHAELLRIARAEGKSVSEMLRDEIVAVVMERHQKAELSREDKAAA
jgi:hypothetical protein